MNREYCEYVFFQMLNARCTVRYVSEVNRSLVDVFRYFIANLKCIYLKNPLTEAFIHFFIIMFLYFIILL